MTNKKTKVKPVKRLPRIKKPPTMEIPFGCVQDYGVHIVFSRDVSLMTKWLNIAISDDIKEQDFKGCNGICFRYDNTWPVICMPNFPKTPREIGTLTHEAFHAVYYVCDKIGINITGSSEEIVSRMISHVVTTVLENKKKFMRSK